MNNQDKLKLSQNIALIAGIFCAAVALLLLLNFWQITKTDPIESKALEALVQRLKDDRNNEELKEEIRNFDLLARKAYFNSQWQVETGAYMLLFGAIVLAFALRVYYSSKSKIEEPEKVLENEIASRIIAQKGIIIVGAAVMVLALLASFLSVNQLKSYDVTALVAENESSAEDAVEVINVAPAPTAAIQASEEPAVEETTTSANEVKETATETQANDAVEKESASEDVAKTPAVEPKPVAAPTGLTLAEIQKNFNALRGPLSQGVIMHKNIPTEWDGAAGTNVLWKVEVPKHGFNSPIIWGDKLFVAGANPTSREVYCYNRNDGKLLWTGVADNIQGAPATPPRVTDDTGLSASTLTTDGNAVFAIFATGDVIAFDMSGKRLWARNLGVPDNHYGHSSSLVTWNGKLIIQYDTNRSGKIMALDNKSGETVWETQRQAKISWASPVLAEVDGKYQAILIADPIVAGYDVETGEELWAVECMMGEVGASVGYADGIVVAANEYARMVAIDIRTHEILWEDDYYLPEASSLLAHDGLLFAATSYGVFVCYDLKEGELLWEDDFGSPVYSSPVYADGKVYLMDNDGVMRIYEFSRELKKVGENALGELSGQTPAFADGRIYIRGENDLYCIGK
ncbi:PQQ-binding-like beta-propeller repeat protein [Draconibacterium sp. IB214405]|uniref:outer membrane protein assembly factor BamB family protein n=1 Tax=Draconibacterium sp. IB214405 TaxID=3097352 RepID=UPI002A1455D6|nr:PQQ-binding-like beta-propeller repeat protein [Draconibacterium sp. IB214405]MDX8341222.1 PQQ-binding-like beta-propeller repeat protein [Draconibacterium sp. IB214405]